MCGSCSPILALTNYENGLYFLIADSAYLLLVKTSGIGALSSILALDNSLRFEECLWNCEAAVFELSNFSCSSVSATSSSRTGGFTRKHTLSELGPLN